MIAVVLGLLISRVSWAALPAALYLPAAAALAVSFGVWLSIRSHATARAIMWYMAVAGGLLVIPVAVWWGFDEDMVEWAGGILAVAAVSAAIAAGVFWNRGCVDFDRYGRE
jgi:hypothetical protein